MGESQGDDGGELNRKKKEMNIALFLTQALLLALGQVWLKLGLQHTPPLECSVACVRALLLNWRLALCGASFTGAGLLWAYIMKHYPMSVAYPMASVSYVFGMVAAVVVFHEAVDWTKWLGVALIVAGCGMIMHNS